MLSLDQQYEQSRNFLQYQSYIQDPNAQYLPMSPFASDGVNSSVGSMIGLGSAAMYMGTGAVAAAPLIPGAMDKMRNMWTSAKGMEVTDPRMYRNRMRGLSWFDPNNFGNMLKHSATGRRIASSTMMGSGIARFGLGAVATGGALALSAGTALLVSAGDFAAKNISYGARDYLATRELGRELRHYQNSSPFGNSSILNTNAFGQGGGITNAGMEQFLDTISASTQMDRSTARNTLSLFQQNGMLDSRSTEGMSKTFRQNLNVLQRIARSVNSDLEEAFAVYKNIKNSGVIGHDNITRTMSRFSSVSNMTGLGFSEVASIFGQGSAIARANGLSGAQGGAAALNTLSATALQASQGAINKEYLAKVGGVGGYARRMLDIQMSTVNSTFGQNMLTRMFTVNGDPRNFDPSSKLTMDSSFMKNMDPYELSDMTDKAGMVVNNAILARVNRIRGTKKTNREANRAQYNFLAESVGIVDPTEQLEYLRNLRTQDFASLNEAIQSRTTRSTLDNNLRDDSQFQGPYMELWGGAKNLFRNSGLKEGVRKISEDLRAFGAAVAKTTDEISAKFSLLAGARNPRLAGDSVDASRITYNLSTYKREGMQELFWGNNIDKAMASMQERFGSLSLRNYYEGMEGGALAGRTNGANRFLYGIISKGSAVKKAEAAGLITGDLTSSMWSDRAHLRQANNQYIDRYLTQRGFHRNSSGEVVPLHEANRLSYEDRIKSSYAEFDAYETEKFHANASIDAQTYSMFADKTVVGRLGGDFKGRHAEGVAGAMALMNMSQTDYDRILEMYDANAEGFKVNKGSIYESAIRTGGSAMMFGAAFGTAATPIGSLVTGAISGVIGGVGGAWVDYRVQRNAYRNNHSGRQDAIKQLASAAGISEEMAEEVLIQRSAIANGKTYQISESAYQDMAAGIDLTTEEGKAKLYAIAQLTGQTDGSETAFQAQMGAITSVANQATESSLRANMNRIIEATGEIGNRDYIEMISNVHGGNANAAQMNSHALGINAALGASSKADYDRLIATGDVEAMAAATLVNNQQFNSYLKDTNPELYARVVTQQDKLRGAKYGPMAGLIQTARENVGKVSYTEAATDLIYQDYENTKSGITIADRAAATAAVDAYAGNVIGDFNERYQGLYGSTIAGIAATQKAYAGENADAIAAYQAADGDLSKLSEEDRAKVQAGLASIHEKLSAEETLNSGQRRLLELITPIVETGSRGKTNSERLAAIASSVIDDNGKVKANARETIFSLGSNVNEMADLIQNSTTQQDAAATYLRTLAETVTDESIRDKLKEVSLNPREALKLVQSGGLAGEEYGIDVADTNRRLMEGAALMPTSPQEQEEREFKALQTRALKVMEEKMKQITFTDGKLNVNAKESAESEGSSGTK